MFIACVIAAFLGGCLIGFVGTIIALALMWSR